MMKWEKIILFLYPLMVLIKESTFLPLFIRGRPPGGLVGVPATGFSWTWWSAGGGPNIIQNVKLAVPEDQWISQRLDHFNDADTRTWKQRYFVNSTFYKPGGPVFLMIGGEGTADPIWMIAGQWVNYAQHFNALCLMLEHRYYGKSHPTHDLATSNLAYLSSEQALADLAHFTSYIKHTMKLTNNKWIAFGGSYPGGLAAWYRLKFPHLVDGSVASSAPVFAQLNFKDYLRVVRDALETTGVQCNTMISKATQMLEDLLKTSKGRTELKNMFRLCKDIDINKPNDIANLFSNLAGNFEGVVQYNKDNRAFEGAVGTNITIDTLCGIMTDSSVSSPLERFAKVNNLLLKTYKRKCQEHEYDQMIKDLQHTSWNSSVAEGGRQWFYQTCTEFGYYQSSDLKNQPFGHKFPVEFSIQQCIDIFGRKFNKKFIEEGIDRTNTNYGGFGLKVTKVVFPNGSIDPWHALGVTKSNSSEMIPLYIKGTAHCANMYPDSPEDPPQLIQARIQIRKLIGEWIKT